MAWWFGKKYDDVVGAAAQRSHAARWKKVPKITLSIFIYRNHVSIFWSMRSTLIKMCKVHWGALQSETYTIIFISSIITVSSLKYSHYSIDLKELSTNRNCQTNQLRCIHKCIYEYHFWENSENVKVAKSVGLLDRDRAVAPEPPQRWNGDTCTVDTCLSWQACDM